MSQPSEPRPAKELAELTREGGVKVCFCTLCKHQPHYGHCFFCRCGNHVPQPHIADENGVKLLATISRLKGIVADLVIEREEKNR